MLLGTEDTSWSCNAYPTDKVRSRNFSVLHSPTSNKRTSPSEACFAVNCDSTCVGLGEMLIAFFNEVIDNFITWRAAINKEKIQMAYTQSNKTLSVVLFIVESDNFGHIPFSENVNVLFRREAYSTSWFSGGYWPHESNKLAWNDPIQVSLVHSLMLFVLFYVEVPEVVPAVLDSELEAAQAMQDRTLVMASALAGVSVRLEEFVVVLEL